MIVADPSNIGTVVLQSKELSFLAEILNVDGMDNKVNPLSGYLHGRLKECKESEQIRESLIAKGILHRVDDGVEMNQHMITSLAAVLLADKACWMKYKAGAHVYEEFLQITNEKIVALERKPEYTSLQLVDEISCLRQACGMLAGKMKWNGHTPDELPALLLSRRKFAEIVAKLDELEWEEITAELSKGSNDQEGISAFAKCLKTSVCYGELSFYSRDGDSWESQCAQFINNHQMNWLIRTSSKEEEDWLIATPTPNEKFQEMLQLWAQQPVKPCLQ